MNEEQRAAARVAAHPILSAWMRASFAKARRRRAVDFRCGMDIRDHWQWLGGSVTAR